MPIDVDGLKKAIGGRALLIEDASHALGATYKDRKVGATGSDFTCFSFQAIKHITTGDGGMLTFARESDWLRAKRLRWFGIDRAKPGRAWDDDLLESGYKFHMNDIAASIGLAQLEDLPGLLARRAAIAAQYEKGLKKDVYQSVSYEAHSAYWLFTLKVRDRATLIKSLDAIGVDASPVHRRNDTYTAFKNCAAGADILTGVEVFDQEMLCIPVGEWVTDADVSRIIEVVNKHCS
jgi:dTDP-4-amino-4,6-dideoxygalactose transaminase